MRKIITIIKREYKEAVFKKSFLILTLLMPVLMIGMAVLPSLLIMMESKKQIRVHVIDQAGWVFDPLRQSLNDTLKTGKPKFVLSRIDFEQKNLNELLNQQKELIKAEQIDVLLVIPKNIDSISVADLYARNVGDFDMVSRFKNTLSTLVSNHRLLASGLEPELINKLIKPVKLETTKVMRGRKESKGGFMSEYMTTFVFIFIIYFTIIIYATAIMRGIIQEKNSRIVETILSGTNARQYMTGKILGQGAVGITQYAIWVGVGLALVFASGKFLPVRSFTISPTTFLYFILFYILGYFLYSTLYAAIGAMVNSEQEAQSLVTPLVFLLVIPLVMIGMIVKDPNSTVVTTLSLIPFFSPIIMFARINLANPPVIQIVLSIALLILTIAVLIWLVAKIFRVGILMYGKRPTFPEIIRWIKY
ncbi:MAG TPA: ABC transporter permease [Caldithrix abyssi]|uniref:ABC transporter permease n=1 Tax=Caldithrix abyssi TaxID=187145 RepID=A0A7V5H5V2_CALAY|nr:ABC transporter permease [Caldithrix abyssi]